MFAKIKQQLFGLPQFFLPHHFLSRLVRIPTHSRHVAWKNFFIKRFVNLYGVNMAEAEIDDFSNFRSFNEFFTRSLKRVARPIDRGAHSLVSPADGTVSQLGNIAKDQILQAKGKNYSLTNLLGGNADRAVPFLGGGFATIYLAPQDYHRLHMPVDGKLKEMIHVPGRLFSVNQATTCVVDNLFGRNERVVSIFETPTGPMALVLVGAMFVASIETVWQGIITPPTRLVPQTWTYDNQHTIELKKGEEMGRFNMGSTIVVVFGKNQVEWLSSIQPGQTIRIGESIGHWGHG